MEFIEITKKKQLSITYMHKPIDISISRAQKRNPVTSEYYRAGCGAFGSD